MGPTRFQAGDPLRALAALAVLVFHVSALLPAFLDLPPGADLQRVWPAIYTDLGWQILRQLNSGVVVFFVLSGYLISRPFVQAFLDGLAPPPVRPYLRNRALRIVPAFWLVATLGFVLYGTSGAGPLKIAGVYAFMQNLSPGSPRVVATQLFPAWTLHVEVVFYLLVPLLAVVLTGWARGRLDRRGRLRLVLGCALLLAAVTLAVRQWATDSPPDLRWFVTTAFGFVPGVLFAALEPDALARLPRVHSVRRLALAAALAGVALLFLATEVGPGAPSLEGLLTALGSGAVVLAPLMLQWAGQPCWRALDNRPLQWLGRRSYGIYLFHLFALAELPHVLAGPTRLRWVELVVLTLAASSAAAALSWRFVEQPFLRRRAPWKRAGVSPREAAP